MPLHYNVSDVLYTISLCQSFVLRMYSKIKNMGIYFHIAKYSTSLQKRNITTGESFKQDTKSEGFTVSTMPLLHYYK